MAEVELLEMFTNRELEEGAIGSSDWNPTDAVLFVGLSLVLGIACRHLLRGTRVPYTVALLVLGIILGSIGWWLFFSIHFHVLPHFLLIVVCLLLLSCSLIIFSFHKIRETQSFLVGVYQDILLVLQISFYCIICLWILISTWVPNSTALKMKRRVVFSRKELE